MRKSDVAAEQMSYEKVRASLPIHQRFAARLMARLGRVSPVPPGAHVVEVGAAAGSMVLALEQMGYEAVGVEPWGQARDMAARLSEEHRRPIHVVNGVAESIPMDDASCDVVIAANVIEHVLDAQAAFGEAWRILRQGGVFWFSAASSVCPRQAEIGGFPLFGWYPNRLKLHIMDWARRRHPGLIGHTATPAINWFTPRKARRMLREAGFSRVWDRWDLRLDNEGGAKYRLALRLARSCRATKLLAEMMAEGCAYAALK